MFWEACVGVASYRIARIAVINHWEVCSSMLQCCSAATDSPPRRVVLMCKEPLVQFYSRAGFELIGPSGVVHGQDPWLLMKAYSKEKI